jgi:type IV pilus assembly protein PilM
MASKRVGVDVGSTAVRAAEVSTNGHGPTLTRVGQVPLEAGAVENGELRDPAAVAAALKELWRVARFSTRNVVLGVANHRVVVREVVLPWLADRELRVALPFQVQEFVPIPVEDAVLDYQVIEDFEQEGRRMLRLLLVVAQKEMVKQLVETAESARLVPVGMDLVPFAVMRSVGTGALFAEQAQDEAVIDVGGEVTSVCIHSNGLPRFVRILSTGGTDVTNAIVTAASVTREQARAVQAGRTPDLPVATLETARHAMSSRAAGLVDEIRSSLDFYESQSRGSTIGRVLVSGGGSLLDGFVESLNERVVPEVTRGHPYSRVSVPPSMQSPEMSQVEPLLAVAIGLAIPGGES